MKYLIKRISNSGAPLISLGEAKTYLKVSHDLEDSLIADLIDRVTNDLEGFLYSSLQASTYKLLISEWTDGCIPVTRGPVASVTTIEYYDTANALQTLDASKYYVAEGVPDYIQRAYNESWPSTYNRQDAIQVTYTTSPAVETKVKSRALQAIAYLYENRGSLTMSVDKVYQSVILGAGRKHFIKT